MTDNDAQKGGGIPGANPNPDNPNPNSSSVYAMAKRGYGAFGGGATLEKSKLDLSQSTSRVSPKVRFLVLEKLRFRGCVGSNFLLVLYIDWLCIQFLYHVLKGCMFLLVYDG